MSSPAGTKILRIGLIQNGRILEERLLRTTMPVTVGHGIHKNTFVVPLSNLPRSQTILSIKEGNYILHFSPGMRGRIDFGDGELSFDALIATGRARKASDGYELTLPFQGRGKVVIGEVTLLFQFVSAPPARPRPILPTSLKGGWFKEVEPVWLIILVISALLQSGFVIWLVVQDWPQPLAMEYEFPDRMVRLMAEPPEPEEIEMEPEVVEGEGEGEGESQASEPEPPSGQEGESDVAEAPAEQPQRERAMQEVQDRTLLRVLGAKGEGGSLVDTLIDGAGDVSAEEAFAGATGVQVAEAGVERSGIQGRGSPDADGVGARAGIDEVGSLKGAKKTVDTRRREEQQVKARPLRIQDPDEVIGGTLDQGAITQAIRRRMAAIQNCYERELRRNNSAGGRVVINFTVTRRGSRGTVSEARAVVDEIGGGVGECVAGEIRNLRGLPAPDGGDAMINIPFAFQPNQ